MFGNASSRPSARLLVFLSLALINPGLAARAETSADPTGVWLTQAGDAKVQITRCGGAICAKVVWLREPIDRATGKPQVDNKNPSRPARPIIGLQLFVGMKPVVANKWSGAIYNADDGKTYRSNVSLEGATALKVEGCVGGLCGGETWTKASGR